MSIGGDRYRHGLHRANARDVFQADRAASPLELLYDLTFLATFGVAASELAHGITSDHGAQAVLAFVVAMTAVLWAWMNFTWFASAFDNDDWLFRLMTMVQMAGVLVVAIALPAVFASLEEGGQPVNSVMVGGYIVMRAAVILQWLRVARDERPFRRSAVTYATLAGAAQLGWLLLATRHLDGVTALGAVGALFAVEALAPVVAGVNGATRRGAGTPWHPRHLAERHTLLAIIALGETVLGTLSAATLISTSAGWNADAVLVIAAGIGLSFALWWTYLLVPHAEILELRRGSALVWGYAHMVLFAAIAATGAGVHLVGNAYLPQDPIPETTVVLAVASPVVVFLATLACINAWLLPAPSTGVLFQAAVLTFPVGAVALAGLGCPLWLCLFAVLACPVTVVTAYELGGWRMLQDRLRSARAAQDEP